MLVWKAGPPCSVCQQKLYYIRQWLLEYLGHCKKVVWLVTTKYTTKILVSDVVQSEPKKCHARISSYDSKRQLKHLPYIRLQVPFKSTQPASSVFSSSVVMGKGANPNPGHLQNSLHLCCFSNMLTVHSMFPSPKRSFPWPTDLIKKLYYISIITWAWNVI